MKKKKDIKGEHPANQPRARFRKYPPGTFAFFAVQLGLLALFLLFPLYRRMTAAMGLFAECPVKLFFHVYCAGCGGTRAVSELFHGQVYTAFRYHAFAVYAVAIFLFFDIRALIRLCRKKTPLVHFPGWLAAVSVALLLLFAVGRNVLLIRFGIDPIGDLAAYWH